MRKLRIVKMIIFASLAITAFGYGLMWLWNSLIPDLFNGPVIGFLQAIGLLLLAKILFGGSWHRRGNRHRWYEHFEERKNAMSPEERERFREQWKQRCGNSWKWRQPATDNASGTKTS